VKEWSTEVVSELTTVKSPHTSLLPLLVGDIAERFCLSFECQGESGCQRNGDWSSDIRILLPGAFSTHGSAQKLGKIDRDRTVIWAHWPRWTLQAACLEWTAARSTSAADPVAAAPDRTVHPQNPAAGVKLQLATLASEARELTPSSTQGDRNFFLLNELSFREVRSLLTNPAEPDCSSRPMSFSRTHTSCEALCSSKACSALGSTSMSVHFQKLSAPAHCAWLD